MPNPADDPLLTLADVAARWQIPENIAGRRARKLRLPAVNIGSKRCPDLRIRLSALIQWERLNEENLGEGPAATAPPLVRAGAAFP